MKKVILFGLLILSACSSLKKSNKSIDTKTLIFSVENAQESDLLLSGMFESLIDSTDTEISSDSLKRALSEMLQKKRIEESKYPNEIIIEITEDGWFKQRFIKNKYTYFYRHFYDKDSIIVYDTDKVSIVSSFKKPTDNSPCKITLDKSKTKNILGYVCYYAKAEEVCVKDDSNDTFTLTYEMYVTDKIRLPLTAILENECQLAGYFPLEVKCFLSDRFYYRHILSRID